MATLGEVSFYTRRIIKWGIIVILTVMITPFVWRLAKQIYLRLLPPPPPPPTVRYGKLPTLNYELPTIAYKPQIKLETKTNTLPVLNKIGKVYFVETSKSRILALDKARIKARSLGFSAEPKRESDRIYKFIHPVDPSTLTVDLISDKIKYEFDWTNDSEIYASNFTLSRDQIVSESRNFFQNLGLLPSDIPDTNSKITYLSANPPKLTPSIAASEANFAKVDLYRQNRDNLPFVTSGDYSPINITLGSGKFQARKIISANYNYSKIIDTEFATYPLKTTEEAWDELVAGGGIITKSAGSQVVVREISLAYYEPDEPQRFVQPVFVFVGDGEFTALVQAVAPEYIDLSQPK